MRDEKPIKLAKKDMIIFNMGELSSGGTHWTCGNGYGMYFDSFGMPPSDEVYNGYDFEWRSDQPVQEKSATSCGWWCILFLISDVKTPEEYYDFILDLPTPFSGTDVNEEYLSCMINKVAERYGA